MDRFQALGVFVEVADSGSFAAAARSLSMSPPAVTRAIAGLEDRLGTRLFVRTTRSVRLTESGTRFLTDARRLIADLAEAEAAAVGIHQAPRGDLRITAPALFGRLNIAPLIGDFLDEYPNVTCQALFLDRVVNMMDEGQDVAIRIGELPDSSLVATRIGAVRQTVFAAPDYLATHGTPLHPTDLTTHRIIHPLAVNSAPEWHFRDDSKPITIRFDAPLRMNTNDAVIDMALSGWGISRLLSYQIAAYVGDGRLVPLLEEFEPPALPVHILHVEGRMVSAKVRAFVDFAAARLRADEVLQYQDVLPLREKT
jgi:DNA-binding transcriptional LysR family regulator